MSSESSSGRAAGTLSLQKRIVFRCASVVLALLAVLLFLELVFRVAESTHPSIFYVYIQEHDAEVTGHRYIYDPLLGWKNVPNMRSTTFGKPLSINSQGYRSDSGSNAADEVRRTILVLGDSFAWGYGVGDGEDFPARLQTKLQDESVRVINSGVSGWGTDQEFLFYRDYGWKEEPDVVVLSLFLLNDPINNGLSVQYGIQKPQFTNARLALRNVPVPLPGSEATGGKSVLVGWVGSHSSLVKFLVHRTYDRAVCVSLLAAAGLVELVSPDAVQSLGDPLALTAAIIGDIKELCDANGAELVVMKFGLFLEAESELWHDLDQRLQSELIRRVPGLQFLDLDREFWDRGFTDTVLTVGVEDGHWNAEGHDAVAAILEDYLRELGLLDPEPTR